MLSKYESNSIKSLFSFVDKNKNTKYQMYIMTTKCHAVDTIFQSCICHIKSIYDLIIWLNT